MYDKQTIQKFVPFEKRLSHAWFIDPCERVSCALISGFGCKAFSDWLFHSSQS